MAMTINGSNPYVNTYNRINNSTQRTSQILSTGSMRPSAAYGASEYAITARLDSNIRGTTQSIQNTQNISAMIRTAAGATSNTVSALTAIKEHLINAANDSNGSLDRAAIQENVNQLIRQIDENAYVDYNGKQLLNGSQNTLTLSGIDGYENFTLGDIRSEALGLTDAQGNIQIDVSTVAAAQSSLDIVDRAITSANSTNTTTQSALDIALDEATTQGAQLQRLEYQEANYTTMEENMLAAQSSIDDADMAKQITNLRNQQTQEQLALFATRMFNQNRANILGMLQ
ncbi:MAG: hypothetical protein IJS69_06560 [Selenomonadaceae bacterium]|nr:hypothetical protein [Selenomonadaceae bacterium]